MAERIAQVDRESLAHELSVGLLTLNDILTQLVRPGRDPREDLPAPVFKRGVLKLEDLTPGMELTGTVLNVVDFGCFVDIGMHDSGLVHVSRLADKFVRDPHDVVAVGDIVKVWVVEIDKERRRVSLTMVPPGSERPKYPQRGPRPSQAAVGRRRRCAGGRAWRPAASTASERSAAPAASAAASRVRTASAAAGAVQRPPRPPRPAAKVARQGRKGRGRPPYEQHRPIQQPRPTPKPLIPITDAMKKGKEPLRTFSDLMQFYQHKTVEPGDHKPPAATEPATSEAATVQETPAIAGESPVSESPVSESVASESPVGEPVVRESLVSEPVADEAATARPCRE